MRDTMPITWDSLPVIAGSFVALVGATVMLAWKARWPALIQMHPTFVPMQFNTALAFLMSAGGLLAAVGRRPAAAAAFGVSAAAIGALTLAQYAFGIDLGIDRMLQLPYLTVKTSQPGRMAPGTALGFLLAGFAIACCAYRAHWKPARIAAEVLASLATGLALVALIGYVTGIESAYGWGVATRMALHTAACFLLIAGSTVYLAMRARQSREVEFTRHAYGPLAVIAMTTTLALWQALETRDSRGILAATDARQQALRQTVAIHVEGLARALERMAARWQQDRRTDRRHWEADARQYVDDDFVEVAWVDDSGKVRWSVASESRTTPRIAGGTAPPAILDSCAESTRTGAPAVGSGARLTDTSFGLLVAVPLATAGETDGCLVALSTLEAIRRLSELDGNDFAFSVRDQRGDIVWMDQEPISGSRWLRTSTIDFRASRWSLDTWPTLRGLTEMHSPLAPAVLAFGVVATSLLLIMLRLHQVALRRAAALAHANDELSGAQRELERLALYDTLTDIGNRNLFLRSFESVLQCADNAGQPAALLVLDLNGFKEINDQLGHKAGDAVLTAVAERISRETDGRGQVFRIGGDEFAVVLNAGCDPSAAHSMALGISRAIAEPLEIYGESHRIDASIGIASFPRHGHDVDALIRKADVAMYEAKLTGHPIVANFDMGATTVLRLRKQLKVDVPRPGETSDERATSPPAK